MIFEILYQNLHSINKLRNRQIKSMPMFQIQHKKQPLNTTYIL